MTQLAGGALWFATNAVLPDLQLAFGLSREAIGYSTSAVQFGFIAGTLCFSFFAVSDRFPPARLFFLSACLGAFSNVGIFLFAEGFWSIILFRFGTGFFLAGIYPVGMKIAASWYQRDLGRAIGHLVGALVLGTSLPHGIRVLGEQLPWETVIISVSILAAAGGVSMLLFVPNGPHLNGTTAFDPGAFRKIFASKRFRASAFGYFGHMWELYTFWAFVPVFIEAYNAYHGSNLSASLGAFVVIAVGSFGCAVGGMLSLRVGSARVAFAQLGASGICCILSPLAFFTGVPELFFAFLVFWGVVVVGDSPQYSTLNAQTAPQDLVGSALTIVTCIGFALTIFSIELVNYMLNIIPKPYIFLLLAAGPVFGLRSLLPSLDSRLASDHDSSRGTINHPESKHPMK